VITVLRKKLHNNNPAVGGTGTIIGQCAMQTETYPSDVKALREKCRVTFNRLKTEREESRVTPDCLKTGREVCRITLNRRKVVRQEM
jgi:hypothetical protein